MTPTLAALTSTRASSSLGLSAWLSNSQPAIAAAAPWPSWARPAAASVLERLGELECLRVGTMALENVPAIAVRSWYDKRDGRAPDGLLPLGLFSRVHIAHAGGYVELVPASH